MFKNRKRQITPGTVVSYLVGKTIGNSTEDLYAALYILHTVAFLVKIQQFLSGSIKIQQLFHLFQRDAGAVISNPDMQSMFPDKNFQINGEWIIRGDHTVFDGIFHQRLQGKTGNVEFCDCIRNRDRYAQTVFVAELL